MEDEIVGVATTMPRVAENVNMSFYTTYVHNT